MNKRKLSVKEKDKELIEWINHLSENFWDFKNEDTKELTHGLHTYPATMIYPISRNIIQKVQELQDVKFLLDPFAGSGTVLVEAYLANIRTIYGNDLNPLSNLLSKVKTTPLKPDKIKEYTKDLKQRVSNSYKEHEKMISGINDFIEEHDIDILARTGWGKEAPEIIEQYLKENDYTFMVPDFKNIGYWFKPNVILELQIILNEIKKITEQDYLDFYLVAFSECVRLCSNRRNGEFKMYRMKKEKVLTFNPDVKKTFFDILNQNTKRMIVFYGATKDNNFQKVYIKYNDSRNMTSVPNNAVDLLVTSPPYGDSRTTVAYGEFSRLSLQWINYYNNFENISKIDKTLMGGEKYRKGFENNLDSPTLKKSLSKIEEEDMERAGDVFSFYEDLDLCLKSSAQKSKRGSYQFWVVGNRTVKNIYLETDKILCELAKKHKLKHIITFTRTIHNKTMPFQNSPTNQKGEKTNTMLNEFIIVLRKQ